MTSSFDSAFVLQDAPPILVAKLPGQWLLKRTTPSWRIKEPIKGFQRVVREDRAKEIAVAVLEQGRTFPNAIVLATDRTDLPISEGHIRIPEATRFLVVDGQHRLWAQRYSQHDAFYACVIHTGLTEVEMAHLFLEINDNQKRVPSSLRWDLVRLVRPDDDPKAVMAAELVYRLATDEQSPLFQRIDLTGEQSEISLKQGSLAPGIKQLLGTRSPLREAPFDEAYDLLVSYLVAIRDQEPDTWGTASSTLYKARVLRALLKLLEDIVKNEGRTDIEAEVFFDYLQRIEEESLDPEALTAAQGNAGIAAIYRALKADVLTPEA